MIQEIDTKISEKTNKRIINELYSISNWQFGSDIILNKNICKKDSGFSVTTLNSINNININNILNTYAFCILDMIQENTFIKFKNVVRIFWNWYHQGSLMEYHRDSSEDNIYSIVYNLHNNDGGTEFKIDEKIKFYNSISSQALLFPSKIYHRGMPPKKDLNRFSLNIMVQI